jgi:hypothetical protein
MYVIHILQLILLCRYLVATYVIYACIKVYLNLCYNNNQQLHMYEICFIALLIPMSISVATTIYNTVKWFHIFYMADCCIPCNHVKQRVG